MWKLGKQKAEMGTICGAEQGDLRVGLKSAAKGRDV
jgi:hypothetical protein